MVGRWTWICDFLEFDLNFSYWVRLLKKPQTSHQVILPPYLKHVCYSVVVIFIVCKFTILSSLRVMRVIKCQFDNSQHMQSFYNSKDKHHDPWNRPVDFAQQQSECLSKTSFFRVILVSFCFISSCYSGKYQINTILKTPYLTLQNLVTPE